MNNSQNFETPFIFVISLLNALLVIEDISLIRISELWTVSKGAPFSEWGPLWAINSSRTHDFDSSGGTKYF